MKIESVSKVTPQFSDIRRWFDDNMLVDKIDLDDQEVYKVYSDAKWSGIFQCTSRGAQQFFVQAKPKSIIDIAILTSIYRPGPLAAKINRLWLDAIDGKEYDWGDKRINKLLEKTKGLLIFQEGVMHLAEHVAGFPKEKCDEVRRAIMKRSISGGDAAKAKVDELKSSFVEGSINNGYTREVAENVYEKICFFSGYGFNCLAGDSQVETLERGMINVKDVVPGEHVNSQNGFVKVLNQLETGDKELYEVITASGKTIKCSLDHKIMTPAGLKTLRDIRDSTDKKVIVR